MAIEWTIKLSVWNLTDQPFTGNREWFDRLVGARAGATETDFVYPKEVRAPLTKQEVKGTMPTRAAYCVDARSSADIPARRETTLRWRYTLDVDEPRRLFPYGRSMQGYVQFIKPGVPSVNFEVIWEFDLEGFARNLRLRYRSDEFQYTLASNPGTDQFKITIERFQGSGSPAAPRNTVTLWQRPPPKLLRARMRGAAVSEALKWNKLVRDMTPYDEQNNQQECSAESINAWYLQRHRRHATLVDAKTDPRVKRNLDARDARIQEYLGIVAGKAQASWKAQQAAHSWKTHWCGIFAYWCVNHGIRGVQWVMGGTITGLSQKAIALNKVRQNDASVLRPGDILYYTRMEDGKDSGDNHYRIVTDSKGAAGIEYAEGNATEPHFGTDRSCTCGNNNFGRPRSPFVSMSYVNSRGETVQKSLVGVFCVLPAPQCLKKYPGDTPCNADCPKGYGPDDINDATASLPATKQE